MLVFRTALTFCLLKFVWCEWDCNVRSGKRYGDYGLSNEAAETIIYPESDNKDSFQVVECTCSSSSEEDLDSNIEDAMRDASESWESSSLVRIYNCDKLRVSLASNDIFGQMPTSPAFIIENVAEMDLAALDSATVGQGNDFLEDRFSSFYLRNATITRLSTNPLDFQDKAEVEFKMVKLKSTTSSDKLHIIMDNLYNRREPILRIERSEFLGADISDGIDDSDSKLKVEVKNQQMKYINDEDEDYEDCYLEYKTKTYIKDNKIGFVRADDFDFKGSNRVEIEDNKIELMSSGGLNVYNAYNLLFRRNMIDYVIAQPIAKLKYDKKDSSGKNNCNGGGDANRDDLLETDVATINLSGNMFRQKVPNDKAIVEIDHEYDSDFVKEKLQADDTKSMTQCNCDDHEPLPSNPSEEQVIIDKFVGPAFCTVMLEEGEIGEGRRRDICANPPILPKSRREHEEDVRHETKKRWTVYVIVAVIVTLILTAIVTAVIVRMCCSGRGDVSPRA